MSSLTRFVVKGVVRAALMTLALIVALGIMELMEGGSEEI